MELFGEGLQIGLGSHKLLLEIGSFLGQSRGFLFLGLELLLKALYLPLALADQSLLLAQTVTSSGKFAQQLLTLAPFFVQGQAHHGGQILVAVDLVGRHFELKVARRVLVADLCHIWSGEHQQTHQQEVANDDENGTIHEGVANVGRTAATGSPGLAASASSSSLRRAGRK